jgi:hypothetical protein
VTGKWTRVQRLDAERLIATLNAEAGTGLRFEGYCSGGEVGAAYVCWLDGHRAVLTWLPHTGLREMRRGSLAVAEALRENGYPVPGLEFAAEADGAIVLVWELLPGEPVRVMTPRLLDQVLALNESQAGAAPAGVPPVRLYLTSDGPGFCLHEPLRAHSDRTRRLERWVAGIGSRYPDFLAGDDAVHCDFTPGNILADSDHVTGVIDWDGAGRGDRRFDLVTFRFGMHALPPQAQVTERLDRLLDGVPPEVLEPAWAHMSLRMTDWIIRHYDDARLGHWLDLAEQRFV